MPLALRLATESDLSAIFDIYDDEILHGTATFDTEPYSEARRHAWLEHHSPDRHPVVVAEDGGLVVGWASLSEWSDRCAYARSAEVSTYVHANHRGRGVGRVLLADLVARSRAAGLGVLLARITSESAVSRRLHERFGFERVGTLRRVGEKFGRILDVDILELELDAH